MDTHETTAKYNLAETCCASLSISQLAELTENQDSSKSAADLFDLSAAQTYGDIRGSPELRGHLSRLYSTKVGTPLSPDRILITPGAIAANLMVLYALVGPGDHVICHHPTYQQLYAVPEELGAEVSLWKSNPEKGWLPDFEELKAMVKENTKLIVLNNPQNPTGAILPKPLLQQLVDFAETKSLIVMSDEVYRPIFHGISPASNDFPPSVMSLGYAETVVTGSLSKAYALAGIRVGWVASRSAALIEAVAAARQYTTLAVSPLDQAVAARALGPDTIHAVLARNIALAKANLDLLDRFVIKHDEFCTWTKPVAGTTAWIRFARDGLPVDSAKFCTILQEKTGVMFLPGDVGFGPEFKGYVRVGFVNHTEVVREGLEEVRKFMRKEFDDVPLSE